MHVLVSVTPGQSAQVTLTVSEADTASALGSGDVEVLATPRVLALCEQATVTAVAACLDPASTTVGTHVALDHRRPTFIGGTVVAKAVLRDVDGTRLEFDVEVTEGSAVVASGVVRRALVDRDRFVGRPRPREA